MRPLLLRYSSPMMPLIDRALAWLGDTTASNDSVADEAVLSNLRRLRWLVLAIIPLNLVFLGVFWTLAPGPTPAHQAWQNGVGWAHLWMALWLSVCGIAAHRLSRRPKRGRGAGLFQILVPFGFMVFVVAVTVMDQWVMASISPFLIGSVFVSLLLLMRPLVAVAVFVLGYGLFFVGIGLTQQDPVLLLSNRLNGFSASLLGTVLALVMWHNNRVTILLQRELASRNAALLQHQEELVWLAKRDALTGLVNRGEFLRLAEQELLRAKRHGTDTSAIMVDLDYFKKINDLYGHPAGDSVLKHAAACLLGGVRETDLVARIGGEEFLVLLPQTSLNAAFALAQKMLASMQQSPAPISGALKVAFTASFGVAVLPGGHEGSVAALYAAADHALYEAKQLGRNRVEKTEPDSSLTPSDFQRLRRQ